MTRIPLAALFGQLDAAFEKLIKEEENKNTTVAEADRIVPVSIYFS